MGKRVLVWSTGQDTGGQGYRIGTAFKLHAPAWRVDVLNDSPSSLAYPELTVPAKAGHRRLLARDLYRSADVVHLRNSLRGWQQQDQGQGKPTLLHHHGTLFREGHVRVSALARQIGAVEVASTLDLVLLEPGLDWLPSPYEAEEMARLRADGRADLRDMPGVLRVAHLPTNAKVKDSASILAALRQLQDEGHRLEIITNVDAKGHARHVSWRTALWHKAKADIYVDQLTLGYGNNAVESWAFGQPVVAGVADPAVRDEMLRRWGVLPFVPATPDTVYLALLRLIESPTMRAEYAQIGREHFDRYHDSRRVVAQLQGLYASATPTRPLELVPYASPGWAARHRKPRPGEPVVVAQPMTVEP